MLFKDQLYLSIQAETFNGELNITQRLGQQLHPFPPKKTDKSNQMEQKIRETEMSTYGKLSVKCTETPPWQKFINTNPAQYSPPETVKYY